MLITGASEVNVYESGSILDFLCDSLKLNSEYRNMADVLIHTQYIN